MSYHSINKTLPTDANNTSQTFNTHCRNSQNDLFSSFINRKKTRLEEKITTNNLQKKLSNKQIA